MGNREFELRKGMMGEIIKEIKKIDVFIKEDINKLSDAEFVVYAIVSKHKNTHQIEKIKNISKVRLVELFADVFMVEYEE